MVKANANISADSSRRRFLAIAAGAGAGSLALAAMPSSAAAGQSLLDAELVQASHGIEAANQALGDLHDKFGDDADSRADYLALERQRNDHIATLITVPSLSAAGVQAKAAALRLRTLIEDNDQHQQVAVSLADDVMQRSLPMLPVASRQPDPVYAAIDTYEKAYIDCRAACVESSRLYDRAIKVAGKSEVMIPDLRGPGDRRNAMWELPVAYERDGLKYVVAQTNSFIDWYLPGEQHEDLRQRFAKRLEEISDAQQASYGCDPDKIVAGPAQAELKAVGDLLETVPTTLPGLLAFLSCLARVHMRDPEMINEDFHLGPLVQTLGRAAAIIS